MILKYVSYWCVYVCARAHTHTRVKVKRQKHFTFYTEHSVSAHKIHKNPWLSVREKLFRLGVTHDLAFDLTALPFKPPLERNSPQRALNPTQSRWGRRICGLFSFICLRKAGVVHRHPDCGWIHYRPPSLKNPHVAHTRPLYSKAHIPHLYVTKTLSEHIPNVTVCSWRWCVFNNRNLNIRSENVNQAEQFHPSGFWANLKWDVLYRGERVGQLWVTGDIPSLLQLTSINTESYHLLLKCPRERQRENTKTTWEWKQRTRQRESVKDQQRGTFFLKLL